MNGRGLPAALGRAILGACGICGLAYVAWVDLWPPGDGDRMRSDALAEKPTDEASAPRRAGHPSPCGHWRIGWTAWADAEFVTQLTARLLRTELGCDVELMMTDIGVQYRGLAGSQLDLMLMAWLPNTHGPYFDEVAESVVDLGPLYTGARLGWAVPTYVPERALGAIEDLHKEEVRKRLAGAIQGIDPGSGLMQASERALVDYGLGDYDLLSGSGAAMAAAVERAIRLRQWIVVTVWSPHWMFARWNLRYLADSKRSLSQSEQVHALARKGFGRDFPAAVDVITRMYFPLEELERAMLDAVERSTEAAVEHYLRRHPARVSYWLTGELPPDGEGSGSGARPGWTSGPAE